MAHLTAAFCVAFATHASATPTAGRIVGGVKDVFNKFSPTFGTGQGRKASTQGWTFGGWTPIVAMDAPEDEYDVELSDSEVDNSVDTEPYMAANGRVRGRDNTDFMMKGTDASLYGWLTLEDEGRAFEYTTDADGNVQVDEVPLDKVKPPCGLEEPEAPSREAEEQALEVHEEAYRGQDLRYLQSQPGAPAVLLLDIDAYFCNKRRDDSVCNYNKQHFFDNWRATAAGYSVFNLNVVTDHAVYDRTPIRNRVLACFYDQQKGSHAYPNSFGSNRCGSFNYRQRTGYGLGRITLHETGHQFGLAHDGSPAGQYYNGISSFKWTPVMGNVWPGDRWGSEALYHWSKGEYSQANNKQDDLRVIERYITRRADDIVGSRELSVGRGGSVSGVVNNGKITDRTDSDSWTFTVGAGGGRVDLVIDRTEYLGGGMLDVDAALQDSRGNVLVRSNPTADRRAFIDRTVSAGDYTLVIRGGAEGTPSRGFSSYSSLGNYGISGTVTNTGTPAPPTPQPPTPVPPTPVPGAAYLTLRQNNGATITGAEFGFLSDGWASEYPSETDVAVTLEGNCELQWTSFDLEDSENCKYDWILITSGGSSQKYCGSTLPPTASFSGSVTVALHSDEGLEKSGFDLEFRCNAAPPTPTPPTPTPPTPQPPTPEPPTPQPPTPVPGAAYLTLRENNGATFVGAVFGFLSDGWATEYPAETDVEVTFAGNCELQWTSFDLEDSENCKYDWILITSGGSTQKYCGSTLPPTASFSGSVTVALHSDEGLEKSGFDLEFRCEEATPVPVTPVPETPVPTTSVPETPIPTTSVPVTPMPVPPATPEPVVATPEPIPAVALTLRNDGGRTVRATAGRLSDGWGTYPTAPEDRDWIEWSLTVRGESCVLQFTSFDVEESTACAYDNLEVLGSDGASLGKFCGSSLPPTLMAGGDSFTVVLRSDAGVAGSGFFMDFTCAKPAPLTLREDAGATVVAAETTGTLSDGWATYPTAPEDKDWAEWSVTVRGTSCVLQFTSFDVEEYAACAYDNLEVLGSDGASLGKFCGSSLPPTLMAGGDSFTVVLRSDAGVAGSGFSLDFACL